MTCAGILSDPVCGKTDTSKVDGAATVCDGTIMLVGSEALSVPDPNQEDTARSMLSVKAVPVVTDTLVPSSADCMLALGTRLAVTGIPVSTTLSMLLVGAMSVAAVNSDTLTPVTTLEYTGEFVIEETNTGTVSVTIPLENTVVAAVAVVTDEAVDEVTVGEDRWNESVISNVPVKLGDSGSGADSVKWT